MCIGNNFSNIFCSLMIYLIINRCILKVFLTKILIFIPIYENILIYATKKSLIYNQGLKELMTGIEPVTSALPRRRSTDWATSALSYPAFLPLTVDYITRRLSCCQHLFSNFFKKLWTIYDNVLIYHKGKCPNVV